MLFSNCVGLQTQQVPESNYVESARMGLLAVDINNKLVVKTIGKDSPTELSGIKRGDIIVSADGKIVMTSGRAGGLPFAGPSKGPDRKRKKQNQASA